MPDFQIRALEATPDILEQLTTILVETVERGGSVGFLHPLDPREAREFWRGALAAAERGDRAVLGAFEGARLVGTVSLLTNCPPNQPHRAEIAKMMTRVSHRGRGVASALLREAETLAAARGKTLLNLDTASEEGAADLYEKMGYRCAGAIPDYALKPHGGLTGTRIYWKRLS